MPILSFSVLKDKLLDHTKTDTTRVWTKHRWKELVNARQNDGMLHNWWKPRTKEKEHLFNSKVYCLWMVGFIYGEFGLWPWWGVVIDQEAEEPRFEPITKMTPDEAKDYVRREGFGTLGEFVQVLEGKDSKRAGGSIAGRPMIRIRFWDGERQ